MFTLYDEDWKIRDSDVVFFVNHFIQRTADPDKNDELMVAHLECIMAAMKIGNACHLYVSPAKLLHMDRIYSVYKRIGSNIKWDDNVLTAGFHSLGDTQS